MQPWKENWIIICNRSKSLIKKIDVIMPKEVQTDYGLVAIKTPRDRDGSFSPEIIKKRQTISADTISNITGKVWAEIKS